MTSVLVLRCGVVFLGNCRKCSQQKKLCPTYYLPLCFAHLLTYTHLCMSSQTYHISYFCDAQPTPPELLNNIGVLHHCLKQYKEAEESYSKALGESKGDQQLSSRIGVTVSFNLARLFDDWFR